MFVKQQLIILAAILSLTCGRPQKPTTAKPIVDADEDKNAKTTFSEDKRDDQLYYEYKFDTSNGITRAETGTFEADTLETSFADIKGFYSYIAPDGYRYTVTYIADDKGYQPRLHKTLPHQMPKLDTGGESFNIIEGINDDRIGSKLLISLGGPVG